MAVLDMHDKFSEAIDDNLQSIGIFVDLSKAFDTINHNILNAKLEHYGFPGLVLNWFIDYLSNRKQYVFFNRVSSSLLDIVCGVPQGSVLGPLLFIIYVNDIINWSETFNFILSADDTNLFYSTKDAYDLILTVNSELSKLYNWLCSNKLSINVNKTNFILLGRSCKLVRDHNFSISMSGVVLKQIACSQFWGVYINEALNWKSHTSYIANKISKSLGVLNRVRSILPSHILLSLYYTLNISISFACYCTNLLDLVNF